METGANPDRQRADGGARRRRGARSTPEIDAERQRRWAADAEAAFVAAGAVPATANRPRRRSQPEDPRVRRDRWRRELDALFGEPGNRSAGRSSA